jgi:hypothetical protein
MIVKVYSTQMGEKSVETSATTWGQLQNDLNREGITYNGMKSVIGESKLTLEADAAILPTTGFTLFLMPKKTKAGADINTIGYKELRAEICTILSATGGENAKAHFNVGKNYTTKGTEELRGLLATWKGITLVPVEAPAKKKKATSAKNSRPKPTRQMVEKVEAVVESVKESKEEVEDMQVFASDTDTVIEIKSPLACSFSAILVAIDSIVFPEILEEDFVKSIKEEIDVMKSHALSLEDAVNLKVESLLKEKEIAEAKAKEEEEARQILAEEKRHDEEILKNQEAEMRRMFGDVQ